MLIKFPQEPNGAHDTHTVNTKTFHKHFLFSVVNWLRSTSTCVSVCTAARAVFTAEMTHLDGYIFDADLWIQVNPCSLQIFSQRDVTHPPSVSIVITCICCCVLLWYLHRGYSIYSMYCCHLSMCHLWCIVSYASAQTPTFICWRFYPTLQNQIFNILFIHSTPASCVLLFFFSELNVRCCSDEELTFFSP